MHISHSHSLMTKSLYPSPLPRIQSHSPPGRLHFSTLLTEIRAHENRKTRGREVFVKTRDSLFILEVSPDQVTTLYDIPMWRHRQKCVAYLAGSHCLR